MAELTRPYCTLLILLTSACWCQRSDPGGGRPSCDHCDWQLFCNCSSSGYSRVPKVTDLALSLDLAFNNISELTDDDLMGHEELRALSLQSKTELGRNFTKFSSTAWQICEDQSKPPPQATGWPRYILQHSAPCWAWRSWTFPTTSWPPSITAGSRSLKLCSASTCSTTRTGSYSSIYMSCGELYRNFTDSTFSFPSSLAAWARHLHFRNYSDWGGWSLEVQLWRSWGMEIFLE